ncbi:MAG: hypothetical protein JNM39_11355 [Bdellovibrionaceae bacterium]|nr:hypothetical protein [Pseudobdellovibrionaceae bacterium]
MLTKLGLFISVVTLSLHASAVATNYFCFQSSLEPNSVYVLGSSDSFWADAAKVSSAQKIEDSDLDAIGGVVFRSDLGKVSSKTGDFVVEPMEILTSGKSQTRKNLVAYVGMNNFLKVYAYSPAGSDTLRNILTVQSTEFKFDSIKRTVDGWSRSSSENEKAIGTITQRFCGTQSIF